MPDILFNIQINDYVKKTVDFINSATFMKII